MDGYYDAIIAEGAALLDATDGVPSDWRERIDLLHFSILSPMECVLGQLYGSWRQAPPTIKRHNAFLVATSSELAEYWTEARRLDEAWRRYLRYATVAA